MKNWKHYFCNVSKYHRNDESWNITKIIFPGNIIGNIISEINIQVHRGWKNYENQNSQTKIETLCRIIFICVSI